MMDEILNEIKKIPDVLGSYIHVNGVNAINSDLPNIFHNKMVDIGNAIDRIIKVNEATKMYANNIEFKFEEVVVFIRPIDSDSSLITFCETTVNKKALTMTTGMLSEELKQAVATIRGQESPGTPSSLTAKATATVGAKSKDIDVNKIIHAGPLASIFHDLQNAFSMAIGPIGEMVMKDTVEAWAKNGDCSRERLAELVEMLCREIDDKPLESEFKKAIRKHLI
jgi:hypothetical protein